MKISFAVLALGLWCPLLAATPQQVTVIAPVADVWSRPLASAETPSDDLRETQVLFGEKVLIHESSGSWVRIEAIEQPEFTHHNKWEGYPGWIDRNAVGSLTIKIDRKGFVPFPWIKQTFLGQPYLWGGLSPESLLPKVKKNPVRGLSVKHGVDCSGLVHLVYRYSNMVIPRDAHEQWMKAKPIVQSKDLKAGDLVFSAKSVNPMMITHVALYEGNGTLVEAPQTGMVVREISFKDKFGKDLSYVHNGSLVGDRVVYFGRYLP